MKKWFIVLLIIGGGFFSIEAPALAQEKVIWDGAEIVKDQSGKMTFTKDVKVYKKDSSGKFVSLTVKKGNYFRVYDIEKYNGKVYYWMSSGYRVQATNLVVFKEVPMNLRVSFFDDYTWVVSSREEILKKPLKYYKKGYGSILRDQSPSESIKFFNYAEYLEQYTIIDGKLQVVIDYSGEEEDPPYYVKEFISGSDVKVVEKRSVPSGYYLARQNTIAYEFPLLNAKQIFEVEKDTLILVRESWEKNNAINSFIGNIDDFSEDIGIFNRKFTDDSRYPYKGPSFGYVSIKDLKPIEDIQPIGTYYITKDIPDYRGYHGKMLIPRNEAVTFYFTQDEYGVISYKDEMHVIKLEYLSKTPLD
ncbi:hypothetical protein KD050_18720 [Psychrobacillus sp. INOP01]|uniref:hypothetical protein n=1 Tax=Psychrobacillus sp. INOP01 TaxID=2829187 RepID=UPI001BA5E373|nr:hypothetical protein [Psychrobacillus sp. INOP01]QUG41285.1 hypothetical protein KD050_18720 [Psychrobacillus sp. INOP01]